ncbi:BamA/TamA family outer membrane protein [Pedobacter duraquae]|uniref:Surface antigen-like protein n=1 Tax=Pedobacter duraquae TaxID=425511 RepID=A0A4R6IL11_9SPHI|nr:BamA/TamA family outer membrane protein [Pedobacter duraquae]TDO22799.1 surface antigen-like protein [Pedobacter duraquae]
MIKRLLWFLLLPVAGFAQTKNLPDSVTVAIAPEYDQVSKVHRDFLGENYRKLWALPVKMRVLDINKERGGLKISKLGGGNQTRSIRFVDPQGKEWVLRTIQKYPERALPANLRPTIAKDIVQDQVSTGHPFGAMIVPVLAEALKLEHANPELVYVGDDPGLGEYRKEFANAAYYFEERAPLDLDKTQSTDKVQEKLQEDNDHLLNEKLVLRARLLDFVVGDWDRHEDNWRWTSDKDKGVTRYDPIPRDRDKVFYKTSGIFPWFLSHQWLKSNLQPYSATIRDVNGWNFNARYFDRYFLNELSEKDWKEEIRYVQEKITPELVTKALRQMPAAALKYNNDELSKALNGRVTNLQEIAMTYYYFLAKKVDIPASDKKEYFSISHKDDGRIAVKIENIKKDGTNGRTVFQRTFDPKHTEEIRLYGFAGEDVFDVNGTKKSRIVVRMVGGADVDVFKIDSSLNNKSKNYIYDRLDGNNMLPSKSEAKFRLANDTVVNSFNKKSFVFDQLGPLFHFNYNLDQGLLVGVGLVYEKQGFRKAPYRFRNELWANYATGRESFLFTYSGDFKELIGKNDLKIDAVMLGPNNLSNFFGLGNDTRFINKGDKDMSYYRSHYDYFNADFKVKRALDKRFTLEAGISTEYYTSDAASNAKRFLRDFNAAYPEEEVYKNKFYAGLVSNLTYDSRDNAAIPKNGIYWKTTVAAKQGLNDQHNACGSIQTEFRSYVNPGSSGFVIANRLGAGTTIGTPTFYQRMQLGGVRTLRGFHTNRFTGRSMVYYNLDLRLKLFDFTSYITPGSVGLIGFNDIGRVWEPGQSSKSWHDGYGGGVYVIPAELILIQAAVGFSKEGALPYISIGFSF